MEVSHKYLQEDIVLIQPIGKLDARSSPTVKSVLQELLEGKTVKIILDLQHVPFIDSSGLAALVSGLRMAREQGSNLVLSGAQSQAQVVFRLTMLDRVFPIYPTFNDAEQNLI